MDQIQNIRRGKTTPDRTRIVYKNWREGFVTPLLVATLIFGLVALVPALLGGQDIYLRIAYLLAYIGVAVVTFVRLPYVIRMSAFLFMVYALGLSELFSTSILGDGVFFYLALIVIATMMLSPRAGIISMGISLVTLALVGALFLTGAATPTNPDAVPAGILDWVSSAFTTILFGTIVIMGFQRLEMQFSEAQEQLDVTMIALHDERNNLEKGVSERVRQLRQVNEIVRVVSSILDQKELLSRVVQLIATEFDCYHTAVYLLDNTGQWAELKEASGDAGHTLRENRYRLDANGKSLIAAAIRSRQHRIALDTGPEPVRFENPILRYTRSEAVLPLAIGNHVLGALDLQSTKGSAFDIQNVDTLQNLANHIATALENARLYGEAQQSLLEMQATQKQYLENAWTSFATEQELEYRLGDGDITSLTREVQVPLILRDQIIGQIQMATNEEWTPDQRSLIETIATQAALALENARLVEESQITAASEKLASEITSKIWSSSSVDAILQTAVRELGRALDAAEATIEIKMED